MGNGPFFTLDDAKIGFNLFCCIYGIGTLGMPANFSRAGPFLATFALLFMAFANIYASVVCSKVMLLAPRSVKTYGDLGEFCMGKPGRYLVLVSQMGVCLLLPCAFFVLGGILLDGLFPGAFKQSTWIIFMAISVLPVTLTPTMKESAGAALAGCFGTLIADVIGAGVLLHGMSGHPSVPTPDLSFKQVATTFGNLSLAYGAAIVIPALQRQHSDPTRMPRVVGVTLGVISALFLALAITGYSAVGCQISGNLLFMIKPDATTGLSALGFASHKGLVIVAYLCMQLHITVALAVILHPTYFILERLVLGMHKKKPEGDLEDSSFRALESPGSDAVCGDTKARRSETEVEDDEMEEEVREYRGGARVVVKYVTLRLALVAALVVASVSLRDRFLDLTDFVGASAITFSCLVLPIVFYQKLCWRQIPLLEKIAGMVVVIVCLVIGGYVTYITGKNLFTPAAADPNAPPFPFCSPEHQFEIYYVKANSSTECRLVVVQPADELAEYRGMRNVLRYVLLRTVLIVLLVVASVALRDHFLDLADFIGASAHSTSCLILPLVFYLKTRWKELPIWERAAALLIIVLLLLASATAAAVPATDAPASPLPPPSTEVCASARAISAYVAAHCGDGEPLPPKCVASFREYARDAAVFTRCEAEAGGADEAAALAAFKVQYTAWQTARVCGAFRSREAQAARECAGDNVHRPWNAATWPLFCHQTFRSYAENRREIDALCGTSASSAAFLEGYADYVATPTCKAYYDAVRSAARLRCGERTSSGEQCPRLFRWYADKQREVETDCLELHSAKPFYKGFYRWKRQQKQKTRRR